MGVVYFFSSEKAQTNLANSLSNRINTNLDTDIEIESAKIDIKGNVQLYSFLIRDHKTDTLFFVEEFKVKLMELEEIFNQTYRFSDLKIIQPKLNIVTYKDEAQSNLEQFFQKLKKDRTSKADFYGSINTLILTDGEILLKDQNTRREEVFTQVDLRLNDIAFAKDSLATSINVLFKNKIDPTPIRLSTELSYSSNRLSMDDTTFELFNGFVEGNLAIDFRKTRNIDVVEDLVVDFELRKGRLPSEIFDLPKAIDHPNQTFLIRGTAQGTLNDLSSTLNLQFSPQSFIDVDLLLERDKNQHWILRSNKLKSTFTKTDLKKLPLFIEKSSQWLGRTAVEKADIDGEFVYVFGASLDASIQLQLPNNHLQTKIAMEKVENQWNVNQQFVFSLNRLNEMILDTPIESMEGVGNLSGVMRDKHFDAYDLDFKLSSLGLEKLRFQNIDVKGKKNEEFTQLLASVKDDLIQLKVDAIQTNTTTSSLKINSQIRKVDLSGLGISPKSSDVRLAANVTVEFNASRLAHIATKKFKITNDKGQNDFQDFTIAFESKGEEKYIYQQGSDFFDLSVKGEFENKNLSKLLSQAVQEAFLIPQKNKTITNQYFSFDFSVKEKLLQSLYPSLESPDKIVLSGFITSLPKASNFSIDLPYLKYKTYRFEGISLKALPNSSDYLTQFAANRIYGSMLELMDFRLFTQENAGRLSINTSGFLGNKSNPFNLTVNYLEEGSNSVFSLQNMEVEINGHLWTLPKNRTPQFSLNTSNRSIALGDFEFQSDDQSLALDFDYRSNEEFSFNLKTSNFNLGDALPPRDKFNFDGIVNTDIRFVKGKEEMIADGSLDVDDLAINQVLMGDFTLSLLGSPQFNTYSLNAGLKHEDIDRLLASGNLFVPEQGPNINLDLELNTFDLSFLAPLGKRSITNGKGYLSGDLNLWGELSDLKLAGEGVLDDTSMFFPSINTGYAIAKNTPIRFRDNSIDFVNARLTEPTTSTDAIFNGGFRHANFKAWEMDLRLESDRFLVYNRSDSQDYLFYGQGFLDGTAHFLGPTKSLTLKVEGSSSEGSTLVIPWRENKGVSDTSFIDFIPKGSVLNESVTTKISEFDESFRGFEMIFDLDINRNASLEIVVDQSSGSTLSGRGSGNILIETNTDGKFNVWGDFITYDGIYNFKNLGLIDKKFAVKQGGTIVWEGDPLEAQMNIEATYQVPGGANPALLVDNPNFNRKIPTEVNIQLIGNLIKPDDPVFEITFPNTTGIVASEINYRLADQQRRQLQALSLLSQGIFISDVSVSFQGITNNLYEKASDVFSTILGSNEGKLNVGLNYLQGEENPTIDLQTEDRIGLTLSTQISDRILINGKIGVPIDGVEETVIVGDVQIDFILNENGTLKAKVFNRENEFRYLGDQLGYTQGMGMSYQVDFNTLQELIKKLKNNAEAENKKSDYQ